MSKFRRSDDARSAALLLGAVALGGPRRTRPLAAFLYGVAISRAHGHARDQMGREIGAVIGRLFSEKTSVGIRVDALEARVDELVRTQRSDGEFIVGPGY